MGAAPLVTCAARWVDPGSAVNRLAFTAIGVGSFAIKFGGFALAIGGFVLLLPALLMTDGGRSAETFHPALTAVGPGVEHRWLSSERSTA